MTVKNYKAHVEIGIAMDIDVLELDGDAAERAAERIATAQLDAWRRWMREEAHITNTACRVVEVEEGV